MEPAGSGGGGRGSDTGAAYVPRRLTLGDDAAPGRQIDEAGLLAMTGACVVLGEPGMGKTELMKELGRRLGVNPVRASRFISTDRPERLVPAAGPLLIDALDEAMSRRDGDVVDRLVDRLETVGTPPVVLACRAREWQSRYVSVFCEVLGAAPTICRLDPLNREAAADFLTRRYPDIDAAKILDHLDRAGLSVLAGNPLTLGLTGRVAEAHGELPATRAALFDQVCGLIWREHDDDRADTVLSGLGEARALDAAGAMSAALLFAGAEAVNRAAGLRSGG